MLYTCTKENTMIQFSQNPEIVSLPLDLTAIVELTPHEYRRSSVRGYPKPN